MSRPEPAPPVQMSLFDERAAAPTPLAPPVTVAAPAALPADPADPPPPEGNILLDRLAGAAIVWITPAEYKNRDALMQREAELLSEAGRRPYIIPEGASNALGAWGYIRAAEELVSDIAGLPGDSGRPVTILVATS